MRPRIRVVTSNPGKWREFQELLYTNGLEPEWIKAKLTEIQSEDLEEIVKASAIEAARLYEGELLIEDAGLFIESLKGFPGPYSSYVYSKLGCNGLLKLLSGVDERAAYFLSTICYVSKTHELKIFKGRCNGVIAIEPRGTGGFGFDPIFIPLEGDGRTFAEMSLEEKNAISHRSKALKEFLYWYVSIKMP
ncbi:MAG: XTP/dITP diphosphatase [Nitrososphaerota archaeon]